MDQLCDFELNKTLIAFILRAKFKLLLHRFHFATDLKSTLKKTMIKPASIIPLLLIEHVCTEK